jgi:hypothetical protein
MSLTIRQEITETYILNTLLHKECYYANMEDN